MLQKIDRDLWTASIPHKLMGLHFGARMTVIHLNTEELVIHSPIAFTAGLRKELDQAGLVKYLIAPNLYHHLFLNDFIKEYPNTKVFGAFGLPEKRKDIYFCQELCSGSNYPWSQEVDTFTIPGMPKLSETLFLHRTTGTLICCDLLLNFKRNDNWLTRLYLKLNCLYGKPGASKLAMNIAIQSRDAVREGIQNVLEWDFDRIIVSHGNIIETGGKEILRKALAWI